MILKHILKFPKVRLYEGSWAEYTNHPELNGRNRRGQVSLTKTMNSYIRGLFPPRANTRI